MVPIPIIRGNKHICAACATRFYDLMKSPAACPKCNQKVPVVKIAARRGRRKAHNSVVDAMSSMNQTVAVAVTPKTKGVRWR